MTIEVGDKIPNVDVKIITSEGIQSVKTSDFFKQKRTLVIGLPGAFTPTCSSTHMPGYIQNAQAIKEKGIDQIVCLSVNDAFVLSAWNESLGNKGEVIMMADGNADLTHQLGTELDAHGFGMGIRSQRYSMIVTDGTVERFHMESSAGACTISSAESILTEL